MPTHAVNTYSMIAAALQIVTFASQRQFTCLREYYSVAIRTLKAACSISRCRSILCITYLSVMLCVTCL